MFSFSIRGLQEAQRINLEHVRDLRTGHSIDEAVKVGVAAAHRASIPATPWDTTALRNSHRIDFEPSNHRAYVHIDQSARNPRGQKPSEYGPHLHRQGLIPGKRGGIRAFYRYVFERFGRQIGMQMARIFISRFRR